MCTAGCDRFNCIGLSTMSSQNVGRETEGVEWVGGV